MEKHDCRYNKRHLPSIDCYRGLVEIIPLPKQKAQRQELCNKYKTETGWTRHREIREFGCSFFQTEKILVFVVVVISMGKAVE